MPRRVDPVKHAAKRQHILDSAAVLIAEQGYDRTTTSQLCSQAGISLGTLYHYFPGKKQIFLAVLTQDQQDTAMLLDGLLDAEQSDAVEALMTFVQHLAEPATAHPFVPKLVLEAMLQAHRDPEIRSTLEGAETSERDGIRRLLARATAAGQVDQELNSDDAVAWISALINALYLEAAMNPTFDAATQLPLLMRTVRGLLRSPGKQHPRA